MCLPCSGGRDAYGEQDAQQDPEPTTAPGAIQRSALDLIVQRVATTQSVSAVHVPDDELPAVHVPLTESQLPKAVGTVQVTKPAGLLQVERATQRWILPRHSLRYGARAHQLAQRPSHATYVAAVVRELRIPARASLLER